MNIDFEEFEKTCIDLWNEKCEKHLTKISKKYSLGINRLNEILHNKNGLENQLMAIGDNFKATLPEGYGLSEPYGKEKYSITVKKVCELSKENRKLLLSSREAHSLGDHKTAKKFIDEIRKNVK